MYTKKSANLSFEEAICIFLLNQRDVIACYCTLFFNIPRNDVKRGIFVYNIARWCHKSTVGHPCQRSSPSRRREAPCEGTNSPRLFTPGEREALAKSKVHQLSRTWPTNDDLEWVVILTDLKNMADRHGSEHWLVKFKICCCMTNDDFNWQILHENNLLFAQVHYSILYVCKKLWQLSKQFVL
jgi:hypothetical protein